MTQQYRIEFDVKEVEWYPRDPETLDIVCQGEIHVFIQGQLYFDDPVCSVLEFSSGLLRWIQSYDSLKPVHELNLSSMDTEEYMLRFNHLKQDYYQVVTELKDDPAPGRHLLKDLMQMANTYVVEFDQVISTRFGFTTLDFVKAATSDNRDYSGFRHHPRYQHLFTTAN
jgi:hypothetical protein